MKYCGKSDCSENNPQPYSNFSKHKVSKDGYRYLCKSCDRKAYLLKTGKSSIRKNAKHKEYSLWTLEEENRYRADFYNHTTPELQKLFGKSKFALLRKAQELGLKKPTFESKFYELDSIPTDWNVSGVYALINMDDNKYYIGSSNNMLKRIQNHIKNPPASMVEDLKTKNFRIGIIKFCDDYLEQEYMYLGNPNLYNAFKSPQLPILSSSEKKRFETRYVLDGASGCWLWIGRLDRDGYGNFQVDNIQYRAHKISYFIWKGKYNVALKLRHQCTNRHCVNPDHLIPGTDSQNCHDRKNSGRANKYGTTWEEVGRIRADWMSGAYSTRALREKYGFCVSGIISNKSWYDPNYKRPRFTTGPKGVQRKLSR